MTPDANAVRDPQDRPQRFRCSRAKGAKLPPDTIVVARPTQWGNPFVAWKDSYLAPGDPPWWISRGGNHYGPYATKAEATKAAVDRYREWLKETRRQTIHDADRPEISDIIKALRGKNLACWCALDAPCHADVLIEIANGPLGELP